jgi:CheY-like chemotaxis protein/HPt (histidine-containing phosphotransfer) domain-containing protein
MDNSMFDDFLVEASDLFNEAEDALLDIEKGINFNTSYNAVFRAFHSVKGAAGMFDLPRLQEHMHHLENLLEKRKAIQIMSDAFIDYLLRGIDVAKQILDNKEVEFNYDDPDDKTSNPVQNTEQKVHVQVEQKPEIETSASPEQGILGQIRFLSEQRKKQSGLTGVIFVVDDEVDILAINQELLEGEGYQVFTFESAQCVLEHLKKQQPDLIITDINMPKMNGLELMQALEKLYPQLPVVIVSGYVTKDICLQAMAIGVAGIIEKPFKTDSYFNIVAKSIEKYRAFKLLNYSLDLIVYQHEEFDKFLVQQGLHSQREAIRQELKTILKQKKILMEKAG